jgi:hypothetical protein
MSVRTDHDRRGVAITRDAGDRLADRGVIQRRQTGRIEARSARELDIALSESLRSLAETLAELPGASDLTRRRHRRGHTECLERRGVGSRTVITSARWPRNGSAASSVAWSAAAEAP